MGGTGVILHLNNPQLGQVFRKLVRKNWLLTRTRFIVYPAGL